MCIEFAEANDGVWCALLKFSWTILKTFGMESQSVGESELAHDGFFLRSFRIEFHEVAEWETRLLVGSYGIFSSGEVMGTHVWCIPFG